MSEYGVDPVISTGSQVSFRDRARDRVKRGLIRVKSAFRSQSLYGGGGSTIIQEIDAPRRWADTCVSSGIILLVIFNILISFPIIWAGFLAILYPPWTAPREGFYHAIYPIKYNASNTLKVMVTRLNFITSKIVEICYHKGTKHLTLDCR